MKEVTHDEFFNHPFWTEWNSEIKVEIKSDKSIAIWKFKGREVARQFIYHLPSKKSNQYFLID
jgi:hypothetical protein